jgi:hypothetical protein
MNQENSKNASLDQYWNFVDGERPNYDQAENLLQKNVDKSGARAVGTAEAMIQYATGKTSRKIYDEHRGSLKRLSKKISCAYTEMREEIADEKSNNT